MRINEVTADGLGDPCSENERGRKVKNRPQWAAAIGDRTPVVTTVATELAASWKPLRKSKTSATPITKKTRYNIWSVTRSSAGLDPGYGSHSRNAELRPRACRAIPFFSSPPEDRVTRRKVQKEMHRGWRSLVFA